jgi:DNA-binding NarL/FixJ family response regulator
VDRTIGEEIDVAARRPTLEGSRELGAGSRILLADDHSVVRQALRLLLEREGFEIVAEASDGREAIQLARELEPDVAVLDLAMPLVNGIDAAREIRAASPRTVAVLLFGSATDAQVLDALHAGVQACVLKTCEAQELIRALREVAGGDVYLSRGLTRAVVDAYVSGEEAPADPLTPRERQVLQLIAEGKTTKEVAQVLCVSVKTVESHRAHITTKLSIRQTAGLVRYAIRRGLSQL